MATTFAPGHPSSKCVECDADLTEEQEAKPVEVKVGDNDPIRVGGLYRCIDCDVLVALLGKESTVDLKGVHKHIVEHVIPTIMARMQLYSIALTKLDREGRGSSTEAKSLMVDALEFSSVGTTELLLAATLADMLDEQFEVDSTETIDRRMWEIIRDATPKMKPEAITDLVNKLELKKENGTVTYLCPNPDCPSEDDRHPIAIAEKVMPTELIEAVMRRIDGLPD